MSDCSWILFSASEEAGVRQLDIGAYSYSYEENMSSEDSVNTNSPGFHSNTAHANPDATTCFLTEPLE